MLLDPITTTASDNESSLAEGSFGNDDQEALLDQVREFQPDEQVAEADQQIYADQGFNYIPQDQRTTPRVTPPAKKKDEILQRAREIAQQQKNSAAKKDAKKAVAQASAKKKAHTETQTTLLEKASKAGTQAKKRLEKKKEKNGEPQGEEQKQGFAKNLLSRVPNKAEIANDLTHGDPRKVVGDLADIVYYGRIVSFALWAIWMVLSIVLLIPFVIPGLIAAVVMNFLLISPKSVYRISKWILELVGVGEALSVLDTFGLSKADIRMSGWQKATILAYDVFIFVGAIVVLTFALAIGKYICDQVGLGNGGLANTIAPAVGKIVDWWTGGTYGTTVTTMCASLNSIGK